MKKYARIAQNVKIDSIPIEKPFSNFEYIESNYDGIASLSRIFSQIRQHEGKTMVVELLEESEDINQENEDIKKEIGDNFESCEVFRLSFFDCQFDNPNEIESISNDNFLGYAIIKKDKSSSSYSKTRIYESVIRQSACGNNFIRGHKDWVCNVNGKELTIQGYMYAQQNDLTCVCAHVALRAVIARFHSDGDVLYHDINQIVADFRKENRTGSISGNKINVQEMIHVLESLNITCFSADYEPQTPMPSPVPFQKYIYGSIESGYPAIVIFKSRKGGHHAIPIFGHTLNQDTWVQRANSSYFMIGSQTKYIPSESWVSMYIAHDDNFGSNFCIPRRYLHSRRYCNQLPAGPGFCLMQEECVTFVIGTMPREVKLSPIRAEVIGGVDYLFTILRKLPYQNNIWARRLLKYAAANQLVLRPILIYPSEYPDHLRGMEDWENKKIKDVLIDVIPQLVKSDKRLWMIELSVPELFSANRRKVGEVLLRSEIEPTSKRDFSSFILARLPGYFVMHEESSPPSNPSFTFIPSGVNGHVKLYGCEK